jgi:hypothetical protein
MSRKNKSTSRHRDEPTRHREVAQAPDKIRKQWSVRILRRGSLTGPTFIEFKFPTQGGGLSELTVRNSDLRHKTQLLDQFSDYLPIFPTGVSKADASQHDFIRALASSAARSIVLLPDRTGFIDIGMFVTHSKLIYADGTRKARPRLRKPRRVRSPTSRELQKVQESYSSLPVTRHIWRSASALH